MELGVDIQVSFVLLFFYTHNSLFPFFHNFSHFENLNTKSFHFGFFLFPFFLLPMPQKFVVETICLVHKVSN